MDGESIGRMISSDRSLADTRMVMLTSLGARNFVRRFEGIGFAAHASKPIRREELIQALSDAVSGSPEPGARPSVTRDAPPETPSPFAGRQGRVLLAEDNVTNQHVALGILNKFGLRADVVANGVEALQALQSNQYDLVLMDVLMPVMDGLEATRRIRSQESRGFGSGIPIVAMTAQAMQGDRERCLDAGMNDYTSKPLSVRALAEVLARWLPEREAHRVEGGGNGSGRSITAPGA